MNKEGLQRRGISPEAQAALKEAYRLCFRDGMAREQAYLEITRLGLEKFAEVDSFVKFLQASSRGKNGRALEADREIIPAEERDGRLSFKSSSGGQKAGE